MALDESMSKLTHLQLQPVTGHSEFSSNHLSIWSAWPPCLQVWQNVKKLENGVILVPFFVLSFGKVEVVPIKNPEWDPMYNRQMAHLGRGFRQLVQAWNRDVRFKIALLVKVAAIFFSSWTLFSSFVLEVSLSLRVASLGFAMDFPQ